MPVDGSNDGTIGLSVLNNVLSLRLRSRTGTIIVLSTGWIITLKKEGGREGGSEKRKAKKKVSRKKGVLRVEIRHYLHAHTHIYHPLISSKEVAIDIYTHTLLWLSLAAVFPPQPILGPCLLIGDGRREGEEVEGEGEEKREGKGRGEGEEC